MAIEKIKIDRAGETPNGRPPMEGTVEGIPEIPRLPLRADMHNEDPRERAKARVAELMDHMADIDAGGSDKYYIPPELVPDGWDYEWKRWSVFNKEDPHYINSLRRTGWDFVPATRHPTYVPMGSADAIIIQDGMVLMERPAEISKIMRSRDKMKAAEQVQNKEKQLAQAPDGQFGRDNNGIPISSHGVAGVKKTYAPMAIPE
jgi:hypothetical protein